MNKKTANNKQYNFLLTLRIFFAISFCRYFCFAKCLIVYADNGNTIVHITNTGHCYHREGCGHLRSDIEITLHDAVVEYGYNPCEDCNPPLYDGPDEPCTPMEKPESNSGNTNSSSVASSNSTVSIRQTISNDKVDYSGYILGTIIRFVLFVIAYNIYKNAKQNRIAKQQYEKDREYYYRLYANIDILRLVGAPNGVYMKNDCPCTPESSLKPYGDYTVYVASKNPKIFHFNPNCGGATLKPVNYCFAYNLQHCKRCATGRVQLPTLEWYFKYMEIDKIKKKYNIP